MSILGGIRDLYLHVHDKQQTSNYLRVFSFSHTGLNQRWHIEISLEFATIEANGVLVYIGRYGHENDSMALELRNGRLYYIFSAGDDVQTVSVGPGKDESIVNGEWQKVSISFQQLVRFLVILTLGKHRLSD